MLERIKDVLDNPSWDQSIEREPLLAFSFYLNGRVINLLQIGDEIIDHLDVGFSDKNSVDSSRVGRAGVLMWLWILGAYEIVRTMCQAKTCFSEQIYKELLRLKRLLAKVRMPEAKMEKPGKRMPVNSNRSPDGWDFADRDLLVGDPENDSFASARFLITEFDKVMSSIKKEDVLCHHKNTYEI